MKVREFLELLIKMKAVLTTKKDVLITRNGVLIALQTPEYLLSVCKDRTWCDMEIADIKVRTDDILVMLK